MGEVRHTERSVLRTTRVVGTKVRGIPESVDRVVRRLLKQERIKSVTRDTGKRSGSRC